MSLLGDGDGSSDAASGAVSGAEVVWAISSSTGRSRPSSPLSKHPGSAYGSSNAHSLHNECPIAMNSTIPRTIREAVRRATSSSPQHLPASSKHMQRVSVGMTHGTVAWQASTSSRCTASSRARLLCPDGSRHRSTHQIKMVNKNGIDCITVFKPCQNRRNQPTMRADS